MVFLVFCDDWRGMVVCVQVKLKSDVESRGIEVEDDIADYVQTRHGGESGIVYCHKKATVESCAMALRAAGITAAPFHGSVKPKDKDENLTKWLSGEILVMCATVAFGMGVDKADVRFVVHHDMPKSPEGLVQEAGRAGRDRFPAESLVYCKSPSQSSPLYVMSCIQAFFDRLLMIDRR